MLVERDRDSVERDRDIVRRLSGLSPEALHQLSRRIREVSANHIQLTGPPPIRRRNASEAPLSFAQERLWFIDLLEADEVHHNDGMLLVFTGNLDIAALRRSIESIVARHEVLRTAFRRDGEHVRQVVTQPARLPMPVADLPGAAPHPSDPVLLAAVREEMAAPLDLAGGQTLRTTLFRLAHDVHVLAVTAHHLVCDLWSFAIFAREFRAHYLAYRQGKMDFCLPELPVQYTDYATWQRDWLNDERISRQLSQRVRGLLGAPPLLTLPTRRGRPAVQQFRGAVERLQLARATVSRLREWSNAHDATLYMSLLAAFKVLLARHSGQRDLTVVTPIATRGRPELEQLIGCFLNMVVIRTDLSGDPVFAEVAERVRAACLEAYSHRELPFERLVAELAPVRSRSHQPIAQIAFVLQNTPTEPLDLPGLHVKHHLLETGRSRMDISVRLTETAYGLDGEIEYDIELFTAAQIRMLAAQFERVLDAALTEPDRCVWNLPILTDDDLRHITYEWNDTQVDFAGEQLIPGMFEFQARRTPDATAVISSETQLTYRELNEDANRLARHLLDLGVGRERRVAVCLPRSAIEVVSILAVMKAGGCYVPVNPKDPRKRRDTLLAQAKPALVITKGELSDELWSPGRAIVDLDMSWAGIRESDGHDLDSSLAPDNLAYVLFTSGSTGLPKGVMVSHRGFVNRMQWAQRNYPLGEADRVLRKATCTFDVSLDELFRALFNGAASVLAPELDGFDPRRLAAVIEEHSVTDADFSPTAIRELLSNADAERLRSLRRIVSGVEELSAQTQQLVFDHLDVTLFNLYGPTEVSVSCTAWRCDKADGRQSVPIGRPMSNVRVYVLDPALTPVPPWVVGEVYVGGAGLARGYLGNPGLTALSFIPDALSGERGGRLYRTGDLARFDDDGVLEFAGRADHQLNLHGYRIEPAEVEALLREHPLVTEAAVVLRRRKGSDARLVAYLVCDQALATAELRQFLRRRTPDYMIPSSYVRLDALPLTSHGKLDAAALPPPGEPEPADRGAEAPRNEIERTLVRIWCEALGRDGIGIHDDFFDLGGNSLTAIRIQAEAGTELGVEVEVAAIFDSPTVAGLALRFASAD